jgi:hypothetical protein
MFEQNECFCKPQFPGHPFVLAVFWRSFMTAQNFKSTEVFPYEILWEMQVTQLLRDFSSPNNEENLLLWGNPF